MSARADSHVHLFEHGFTELLPATCGRRDPSEATLYDALAKQFGITHALVVGYEGVPVYHGNNDYLARLIGQYAWFKPVAFVTDPERLTIERLERFRRQGFVGISMYLFSAGDIDKLRRVPGDVWRWLTTRRWLVSVNSRGTSWQAWSAILAEQPELRLLISHLGLPPAHAAAPARDAARTALQSVLGLARFPGARVKLSGFYALSQPMFDYPHQAAFVYVELLLDSFGPSRLLWGSDFSPSLEYVSFQQTLTVLDKMPFLSGEDRRQIEGGNLVQLFDELERIAD